MKIIMRGDSKITIRVLAIAALLLFVPLTIAYNQPQQAFAAATGTLDPNGLKRMDPSSTYNWEIGEEYYIEDSNAPDNFRDDGSMRINFIGKETDSLQLSGYFNIAAGSENGANQCTTTAGEEISGQVNGGPHTNTPPSPDPEDRTDPTPWPNQNSADTMDLGLAFSGDSSRLRYEPWHVSLIDGPTSLTPTALPMTATNMCTTPGGWVGFTALKINIDSNCDEISDKVWWYILFDEAGLNTNGTPKNSWEIAYSQKRDIVNIDLKGKRQSWAENVGQGQDREQTIRIDEQSQQAWLDSEANGDNVYRYVTLKRIGNIANVNCPAGTDPVDPLGGSLLSAAEMGEEVVGLEEEPITTGAATETADSTEEQPNTTTVEQDSEVVEETGEEEEELAQEDDPQDPDNNDETADDLEEEEEEEEEEE